MFFERKQGPNQVYDNARNITTNDGAYNSNCSSSLKSSKSVNSLESQGTPLSKEIIIQCGNNYTTNNYHQYTTTTEIRKISITNFQCIPYQLL